MWQWFMFAEKQIRKKLLKDNQQEGCFLSYFILFLFFYCEIL